MKRVEKRREGERRCEHLSWAAKLHANVPKGVQSSTRKKKLKKKKTYGTEFPECFTDHSNEGKERSEDAVLQNTPF